MFYLRFNTILTQTLYYDLMKQPNKFMKVKKKDIDQFQADFSHKMGQAYFYRSFCQTDDQHRRLKEV